MSDWLEYPDEKGLSKAEILKAYQFDPGTKYYITLGKDLIKLEIDFSLGNLTLYTTMETEIKEFKIPFYELPYGTDQSMIYFVIAILNLVASTQIELKDLYLYLNNSVGQISMKNYCDILYSLINAQLHLNITSKVRVKDKNIQTQLANIEKEIRETLLLSGSMYHDENPQIRWYRDKLKKLKEQRRNLNAKLYVEKEVAQRVAVTISLISINEE
jgi:hypothetical protein